MSLRINTLVRKIPHILLALLGIFLVACLVKVAIWEHYYYSEKEGTPRNQPTQLGDVDTSDRDNIDETEITEEQIFEYTVEPNKPRYLMANFMGKNTKARVREVGLTKDGAMATLASIFDVAWYRDSGKPGEGGTVVMNAHNGGPTKTGIFKHLDLVQPGDIITIERGDGAIFKYEAIENKILPLDKANANMANMLKSPIAGRESLSLISCTGEWSQQQRTYLSRTMVRAVLVEK